MNRLPGGLLFGLIVTLQGIPSGAQVVVTFRSMEDSIRTYRDSIRKAGEDTTRITLGKAVEGMMLRTCALPGAFTLPFDSLNSMERSESPDGGFRIFTWDIPMTTGQYRYYGVIQWNGDKFPDRKPVSLSDLTDSIPLPETTLLDAMHWFGALYYKIIAEPYAGGTVYTLLGWKGMDFQLTCKVIEILSFDERGRPRFGMKLFPGYQEGKNVRVIFRFSSQTSMALRYEEQLYTPSANPEQKKAASRKKKTRMIICDRLVPLSAGQEGMYRFYIPAGDTYDAFLFGQDGWQFLPGVDARNR
ncbi:MAG TPA: hypothetical protein VMC08_03140 [Bacteroidales bacterium]|nr:hypothetical protein [Bacteroidales bacterium]